MAQPLAREIAASELRLAARQYAGVIDAIHAGEGGQVLLRARLRGLEACALVYATACGWQDPDELEARLEGEVPPSREPDLTPAAGSLY